jgi:multiple sugar transport system permease protein
VTQLGDGVAVRTLDPFALKLRRRARRRRRAKSAARYIVLALLVVVVLFPVYWIFLSTFQPERYSLTFPPPLFFEGFTLTNLTSLFDNQPIASWLGHSFLVSAIAVVITIALAIPGGFLLSRLRWRGVGIFGFLLLFTQIMPGAMIIVPELRLYDTFHWTNNLFTLPLIYAAFSAPLGSWVLKAAFDSVPGNVVEASIVDGCGPLSVLRRILVPLSRPGVVAVIIIAFFSAWNDYLFASAFLTDRNLYTAGVGISTFIGQQDIQLYQLQAAGLIFSILPVCLYLAVQKHVVKGLTAGAVK